MSPISDPISIQSLGAPGSAEVFVAANASAQPLGFVVRSQEEPAGPAIPHPDPNVIGYLSGFAMVCTHMGCSLAKNSNSLPSIEPEYRSPGNGKSERLTLGPCGCHGTTFDLLRGGIVILGPATQSLPALELEIVGDTVVAKGWHDQESPEGEKWGVLQDGVVTGGGGSPAVVVGSGFTEITTASSAVDPALDFLGFINSANTSELTKILGIGSKFAEKIVQKRSPNLLGAVEELAEVKGISLQQTLMWAGWYDENKPL